MRFHLKEHCIETAAKKERGRIVSALLELNESNERFQEFADDLDLVTAFLESSDFGKLRSERRELAGGCDVCVELTRAAEGGRFTLTVVEGAGVG
jgi:hypothetical protein